MSDNHLHSIPNENVKNPDDLMVKSQEQDKFAFQQEIQNIGHYSHVYLKDGPQSNRKCQDIICIAFLTGIIVYYIMAFIQIQHDTNPYLEFGQPYDSDDRPCGVEYLKEYPYIYYVNPVQNYTFRTTCVKECPTDQMLNNTNYVLKCATNSQVASCQQNLDKNNNNTVLIYATKIYLKSICLPVNTTYHNSISQALLIENLMDIIYNLKNCLPLTIGSAMLTFILGAIFTTSLMYCAGITLWFFIFSVFIFSGLIGMILLYRSNHWYLPLLEDSEANQINLQNVNNQNASYTIYTGSELICAILCFGLSLFTLVYTLFSLKKIMKLRSILRLSAIFISHNWIIHLMPIIFFIKLMVFFGMWIYATLYIIGNHMKSVQGQTFHQIDFSNQFLIILIGQWIFLILLRNIIVSFNDFITTLTASLWYYQKEDNQQSQQTSLVWKAYYWAFRYHMGSLIFSSFILNLFERLREIVGYVFSFLLPYTFNKRNQLSYYLSICTIYACCYFQKIFMQMTRYSYVLMAMQGSSFCHSAKDSYYLIKRNQKRFEIVQSLGNQFNTLGKLFLTLTVSTICYIILIRVPIFSEVITESLIPVLSFVLVSYTTGSLFVNMHGQSSDALLLISFIDEEIEKVHYGREDVYSCPVSIRPLINELRKIKLN